MSIQGYDRWVTSEPPDWEGVCEECGKEINEDTACPCGKCCWDCCKACKDEAHDGQMI